MGAAQGVWIRFMSLVVLACLVISGCWLGDSSGPGQTSAGVERVASRVGAPGGESVK